jgi:thioredoxin reductase (NADPH)
VLTTDDVGRIPLFAPLSTHERERLARAAADIVLEPGENAASTGDGAALFGLLEGTIEAIRHVDGNEEVVGERSPGDIFGEVPVALATSFPVDFRAKTRVRTMRVEPPDYYAIASVAPEIVAELGRLAVHRMGGPRGLQALAAQQREPRAVVVGGRFDSACAALRRFLDRNQVSFSWIRPDDEDASERWEGTLPSDDDLPTVRVIGGKTVVRPQLRRVAELLELGTEPKWPDYETIVIGAGPAGLAAAVYGASEGLSTMVVEREAPGGQAGTSSRIENYLGFPTGITGEDLAKRALEQAKRLGAEILVTRTIERIDPAGRQVHLDGGDVLRAKTIILACGVSWRKLEVEGFDRLVGKGIYYGAAPSDAPTAHGLDVHLVGAGNSAGQAALNFAKYAKSVTIHSRSDSLHKSMSHYLIDQLATRSNISVDCSSQVTAAHGESSLEAIDVHHPERDTTETVACGGLYVFIGADAETEWLPPEIALDPRGFVLTGTDVTASGAWALDRDPYLLETSVPGIFACGDVRSGPVKRVAAAVGEGSMAIAFVHQYLRDAETRAAEAAAAPA